jgi:hypothetical protein
LTLIQSRDGPDWQGDASRFHDTRAFSGVRQRSGKDAASVTPKKKNPARVRGKSG